MLTGHVAGGQIGLDEPLGLPEGAVVSVIVTATQAAASRDTPKTSATLREQLKGFLEHQIHDLPPDAAGNLDHYLYGMPKR